MSAVVDEEARLAALSGYHVLGTDRPAALDELAALAAAVFDLPTATVSLVDRDRIWFAGRSGWAVSEVPRATSFATHVVGGTPLVVPDTLGHPVFGRYATGPEPIRFYAGAPVTGPAGHVLGALCLIGPEPRAFGPRQLTVLTGLAGQAARHLGPRQLRRSGRPTGTWRRSATGTWPPNCGRSWSGCATARRTSSPRSATNCAPRSP